MREVQRYEREAPQPGTDCGALAVRAQRTASIEVGTWRWTDGGVRRPVPAGRQRVLRPVGDSGRLAVLPEWPASRAKRSVFR